MESFCPNLFPIPDHFPSPESALHPAERPGQFLPLCPQSGSPGPRLEVNAHRPPEPSRCPCGPVSPLFSFSPRPSPKPSDLGILENGTGLAGRHATKPIQLPGISAINLPTSKHVVAANKLDATTASANYGLLVTIASAPVNHSPYFVLSLICSPDLPTWHLHTAHGPRHTPSVVSTAIIQRWDCTLSTCSKLMAEEKKGPQAAHRQHQVKREDKKRRRRWDGMGWDGGGHCALWWILKPTAKMKQGSCLTYKLTQENVGQDLQRAETERNSNPEASQTEHHHCTSNRLSWCGCQNPTVSNIMQFLTPRSVRLRAVLSSRAYANRGPPSSFDHEQCPSDSALKRMTWTQCGGSELNPLQTRTIERSRLSRPRTLDSYLAIHFRFVDGVAKLARQVERSMGPIIMIIIYLQTNRVETAGSVIRDRGWRGGERKEAKLRALGGCHPCIHRKARRLHTRALGKKIVKLGRRDIGVAKPRRICQASVDPSNYGMPSHYPGTKSVWILQQILWAKTLVEEGFPQLWTCEAEHGC
ncbi:uncharacterized protein CLUP02_02591 [Colletotrichum lupini]|uniref:Uncharacterized protein n=1 Tax=Colletotrichum lupini TaxID=145971 RepID=A0A9Q8WBE4_9PEZI|nr:uncharacterized protein CLUP02_02591 [Colletotrichum lupini]UQC77124.1 hypothetical protein CLUP02_02591 [Colletotrichum lupini]